MSEQATSFEEKVCMQWKQAELIGGAPVYYLDESHAVAINNYIDRIDIVFFERVKENDKYYCRIIKKHSLDAKQIKEDYDSLNEEEDISKLEDVSKSFLHELLPQGVVFKTQQQIIDDLIKSEVESSTKKHGEFNSTHEGYSVLLEEIEECSDELKNIEHWKNNLWQSIKTNNSKNMIEALRFLKTYSKYMLKEGVQVAAMVEKYIGLTKLFTKTN